MSERGAGGRGGAQIPPRELLACAQSDVTVSSLASRPSWALRSLALLLWAVCGCSQLVDVDDLEVRCELADGEPDPCGAVGKRCGAAGVCETCDESVEERCDGLDNDCDGEVDEGHDEDDDGFSWCGGGVEELRDCIDEDPRIHPASVGPDGEPEMLEVCDGKDNDCNGEVDDSDECADIDCTEDGCIGSLECDEDTGKCIAPRPEGSTCGSDVECAGGFCVDTAELGLTTEGSGEVCASACCVDGDCEGDDVCVVSGVGLRACVPARIAARSEGGDSCMEDSECGSGLCVARRCVETCSTNDDCLISCVVNRGDALMGGDSIWACGANPLGRGDDGDTCFEGDPTGCKSSLCLDSECHDPCATTDDCPDGRVCDVISTGQSRLAACVSASSSTQTCCTNDDCDNDGVCRPVGSSGSWSMYCD